MMLFIIHEDEHLHKIVDMDGLEEFSEYYATKAKDFIFGTNSFYCAFAEYSDSRLTKYQDLYVVNTDISLEQLKGLLIHDFYIDDLALAAMVGKVEKIC